MLWCPIPWFQPSEEHQQWQSVRGGRGTREASLLLTKARGSCRKATAVFSKTKCYVQIILHKNTAQSNLNYVFICNHRRSYNRLSFNSHQQIYLWKWLLAYIWVGFTRTGILAILGEFFEKSKRSLCKNQER